MANALPKPIWVTLSRKLSLDETLNKKELVLNAFQALFFLADNDDDEYEEDDDEEDKAASFFLLYTDLSWPCELKTLKSTWKKMAKLAHPDNGTTGNSHHFMLLKTGFDVLKNRL